MAERILKNQTAEVIKINDLGAKEIPAFGEIDFGACYHISMLAESDDLAIALTTNVNSVSGYSQYLILNDGDNDLKAVDAIDLIRNIPQKTNVSPDGDWKIVVKNPAHISTNNIIDKQISCTLTPSATYTKKYKIPQDKIWHIENIGGSSEPTCAQICFLYEEDGHYINPFVDACTDYEFKTLQVTSETDTVIFVDNSTNALDFVQIGKHYEIEYEDEVDDKAVIRKIISVDKGNNSITIDEPLGFVCDIGGYVVLIESSIRSLMFEKVTNTIPFGSPIQFRGGGDKYIVLQITNTNSVDDSKVTCFFNGWEEPLGV